SKEVTMDEIGDITDYIQDQAGLTADIIWGNCHEEQLGEKLSVTIIATGFKTREEQGTEISRAKDKAKTVHTLDEEVKVEKPPAVSNVLREEPIFNEPVLKKELPVTPPAEKEELSF